MPPCFTAPTAIRRTNRGCALCSRWQGTCPQKNMWRWRGILRRGLAWIILTNAPTSLTSSCTGRVRLPTVSSSIKRWAVHGLTRMTSCRRIRNGGTRQGCPHPQGRAGQIPSAYRRCRTRLKKRAWWDCSTGCSSL